MQRVCSAIVHVGLLVTLAGLGDAAWGAPYDDKPKILLHLMPVTTKNVCTTYGNLDDCNQAVTRGVAGGPVGTPYFMYLLAASGPLRDTSLGGNGQGVAGMQCGLYYDNAPQSGLDIFTWNLCATLDFAEPGWPASSTGNLITWDPTGKCQKGEVAIAGYFYCAAYSEDRVFVNRRNADGEAKIADCQANEFTLGVGDLGSVSFTAVGNPPGCNPCQGYCNEFFPLPLTEAPPPPTATPECNGVLLTWTSNTVFPDFRVFRDGQFLAEVGTRHYRDSSPGAGEHCYTLAAYNGFESPRSTEVCVRARTAPLPTSVEPAGAAPGATVEIHGSQFEPLDEAVSAVYFNGSEGLILPATILEWTNTLIRCVVPEGASSGEVMIVNGCGQTHSLIFTPVAVTNLLATPADDGFVLSWDAADDGGAVGFNVYRRAEPGQRLRLNDTPLPVAPRNRFVDDGLSVPGRYAYAIEEVLRAGGATLLAEITVEYSGSVGPPGIAAIQPNPAHGSANITYRLAADAPIRLEIFDVQGRRVATLVEGLVERGRHMVSWDGRNGAGRAATPGMYVVRLRGPGLSAAEKVVLSR